MARLLGLRRASVGFFRSFSSAAGAIEENDSWSWSIRRRVMDSLETKDLNKGNSRHSPNFHGAEDAANQVVKLPEFEAASSVYVQTDLPLKPVREFTLKENKVLVIPCMVTSAFLKLDPAVLTHEEAEVACGSRLQRVVGVGEALELDSQFKVDLIVLSSVAVDPATGARIGMGQGAGDIQYALLQYLKAIDDSTPIVTMVDDKQLVNDLPAEKMLSHDVPVDIICTPTKTIHTNTAIPRPKGIHWHKISPSVLSYYKVLRDLREKVECEGFNVVRLAPRKEIVPRTPGDVVEDRSIFVRGLTPGVSEFEVKEHLGQLGIPAENISLFKPRMMRTPCVLVTVVEDADFDEQISKISSSKLKGCSLTAERYQKKKSPSSKKKISDEPASNS